MVSCARASSVRLYWEYNRGFFNSEGVSILVAVTVFQSEQYQPPRLFADEMRAAFKPLREGRSS